MFGNKVLLHLAGILSLLAVAIFNRYPLFTSDSGAYLNTAFDLLVPADRPVFYGWLINLLSLRISLWLLVFLQASLLYFLIHELLSSLFAEMNEWQKVLTVILTTVFSSVSWFVSQVMPDIYTPMVFLSAVLVLFSGTRRKSVLFAAIFYICLVTHNSHLIVSAVFAALVAFLSFFYKGIRWRRVVILAVVVLTGWFSVIFTNYYAGFGFTTSKVSHVFIMAKLCENGILKEYLNDKCPGADYKLCAYKDDLPYHAWDFMWSPDGAFEGSGGWSKSKEEYDAIIRGTFSEPKYIKMHIAESYKATRYQLTLTYVADGLEPHINGQNPSGQVQKYYPLEYNMYLNSRQNKDELRLTSETNHTNDFYHYSFLWSFIGLPFLFFRKGNLKLKVVYVLMLLFVILNAWATASFANILGRLNSRAIWLIPFFHFVFIVQFFSTVYSHRMNKKKIHDEV
jgi:hypothetical protein